MAKKPTSRRKPPTGARPVLQFRVHEGLYEALKVHAAAQKLTISEAAADILSKHMGEGEMFPGIQKTMMLLASGFWHAAGMKALQRGLSHDYANHGEWLKDPECYRAGVMAVMTSLLDAPAISSPAERKQTLEQIAILAEGWKK